MAQTLDSYTDFISQYLMPRMKADHPKLSFLVHDHNPDALQPWASETYADPARREWAWGAAVHWYSQESYRGIALNKTHNADPDKPILHTEGCACRDLPYPTFSHGSGVSWWSVGENYGVGLVQYIQNWAVGFTDWNMVSSVPHLPLLPSDSVAESHCPLTAAIAQILDEKGGPSHDRGFGCNAPFMSCPAANASCAPDGLVYQAPFYFMAHFSKYLPPGSVVVGAMTYGGPHGTSSNTIPPLGKFYYPPGAEGAPGSNTLGVVSAVQPNGTTVLIVLNTANTTMDYVLRDPRIGSGSKGEAHMSIPGYSIQTLRWNPAVEQRSAATRLL